MYFLMRLRAPSNTYVHFSILHHQFMKRLELSMSKWYAWKVVPSDVSRIRRSRTYLFNFELRARSKSMPRRQVQQAQACSIALQ